MAPAADPNCPECRGNGWRLVPVEGSPLPRAVACGCQLSGQDAELVAAAQVPARYRHCTLENFDTGASRSLQLARAQAATYVRDYPGGLDRDRNGLLLSGPPGTGKTHLAVAIAQALLERGVACRFCDYRELLKRIQASFDPANPATESSIITPLLSTELLVLDDLGVGRATDWALETLHYLLNHRYSHKLATILTTNYPDAEARETVLPDGSKYKADATLVDAVGVRLRSRLAEMCVFVTVEGSDFRRANAAPAVR